MSAHEEWCNGEHGDSGTCQAGQTKSEPVRRARLLGSSGKGLGQQTGGTAATDSAEAYRIVEMIAPALNDPEKLVKLSKYMHHRQVLFLKDMVLRACFGAKNMNITGQQLFLLRDLKDRLVSAGLV